MGKNAKISKEGFGMGIISKPESPWDLVVSDSITNIESHGGKVIDFRVERTKATDTYSTHELKMTIIFSQVKTRFDKNN